MTHVIEIKGLGHWFGHGDLRRQILFDIDLSIAPGEIVILTGPSGSGKTTLLTLIGALRAVEQGSLRLFGRELHGASDEDRIAVRRRIGFIFQQHNLLGFLSARQNVEMALELEPSIDANERRNRATAMLSAVGLGERLDHPPAKLSGGQKQRVAVARALVGNPDLVLADEPTASLDRVTGHEVASLIERLARERGASILLVTHDPRILGIADRIIAMEDGRIVDAGEHGVSTFVTGPSDAPGDEGYPLVRKRDQRGYI